MATLNTPCYIALNASSGALFMSEYVNEVIRVLSSSGEVSTLNVTTGTGPEGVAISPNGASLFFTKYVSGLVVRVDASLGSAIVAGGGAGGLNGSPATSAALGNVPSVTADALGGVYIASSSLCVVVYVNNSGIAKVFAGVPGLCGYSGDNSAATSAKLLNPAHAIIDGTGMGVYIVSDKCTFVVYLPQPMHDASPPPHPHPPPTHQKTSPTGAIMLCDEFCFLLVSLTLYVARWVKVTLMYAR